MCLCTHTTLFIPCVEVCLFSKSCNILILFSSLALIRSAAVSLFLFLIVESAPVDSNKSIHSTSPLEQASCKGVLPAYTTKRQFEIHVHI